MWNLFLTVSTPCQIWLINWLLLNLQRVVFQLYPGREQIHNKFKKKSYRWGKEWVSQVNEFLLTERGFVAKMISFKFKCPNYQTHIKVTVFMCPVSRSALKSALMIYLKDIPLSKCEIYFLQYQNKGLSWA
jgi:hypothetical protein